MTRRDKRNQFFSLAVHYSSRNFQSLPICKINKQPCSIEQGCRINFIPRRTMERLVRSRVWRFENYRTVRRFSLAVRRRRIVDPLHRDCSTNSSTMACPRCREMQLQWRASAYEEKGTAVFIHQASKSLVIKFDRLVYWGRGKYSAPHAYSTLASDLLSAGNTRNNTSNILLAEFTNLATSIIGKLVAHEFPPRGKSRWKASVL